MYSKSKTILRTFRLICLFSVMSISTSVSADMLESHCASATVIELNTTIRAIGADEPQCFAAPVGSAGNLSIDVSISGAEQVEPRLVFGGPNCGRPRAGEDGFTYVERRAASMWAEVRAPGTYSFCVVAQDPRLRLGEFKVRTAYSDGRAWWRSYLTEDEPDPEPRAVSRRGVLDELCRSGEVDDHGETFACATRLQLGREIAGDLRNDSGDDRDLFMFHLAELMTVEIATGGTTDTFGVLYDRRGHRLATADEGSGDRNFRMVKTLGPGRYFVRVEGRYQAEGAYRLTVTALP